jgi:regulator of cell morphogenesis and NO signaling
MKLADMLFADYNLIFILSRLGIKLGFGEKTIEEVCRKYNVSASLLLTVANVSTYSDYCPVDEDIKLLNVEELINYLHASHIYYLEDRMKSIEMELSELYVNDPTYGDMLNKFFSGYKNEVINHFEYEEKIVFPYVKDLIHKNGRLQYHIDQFEENHSNIEDKLDDLINILMKYLPETGNEKKREDVLFSIFLFSKDLNKHTLIEDKVLVPCVKLIEAKHGQQ